MYIVFFSVVYNLRGFDSVDVVLSCLLCICIIYFFKQLIIV